MQFFDKSGKKRGVFEVSEKIASKTKKRYLRNRQMSVGGSFLCFLPLWHLAPRFKKNWEIRTFLIRREKNGAAVKVPEKNGARN